MAEVEADLIAAYLESEGPRSVSVAPQLQAIEAIRAEHGGAIPDLYRASVYSTSVYAEFSPGESATLIRRVASSSDELDPYELAMLARLVRNQKRHDGEFPWEDVAERMLAHGSPPDREAWSVDYWMLASELHRARGDGNLDSWVQLHHVPCSSRACPVPRSVLRPTDYSVPSELAVRILGCAVQFDTEPGSFVVTVPDESSPAGFESCVARAATEHEIERVEIELVAP